ncbi:MAG: polysulfide reductase NrfD [Fimbriimonadaceae bacterium]|nr:polysulfide reductase NrfD [Fimbriimonadaceae bacterium]
MNAGLLASGSLLANAGFVFPNEKELTWSILIVLYPYITGLVAGAFILASLVRVFNAKALAPAYRLALLTSLAFLIVAPLPLVAHLGHPERALQIMMTPHLTSAMAVFGFVYLWYLAAVLLIEVWFDFRKDIVVYANRSKGLKRLFYNILTLGFKDLSEDALAFDDRAGRFVTVIGIPSAVLLHGYVGFIFGSLKGNPWWSSVLMPLIFLLSAIVSGISLVMVLYMVTNWWRREKPDMACVAAIGRYLMFALIFDLTLEGLDLIHRMYEAGEWFEVFSLLRSGYVYETMFGMQLFLGGLVPLGMLAFLQFVKEESERIKMSVYFLSGILVLTGVFFMRWNVVIVGQLFSKSLHGLTTYKLHFTGHEGGGVALLLLILPVVILWVLTKLLPPWSHEPQPASDV